MDLCFTGGVGVDQWSGRFMVVEMWVNSRIVKYCYEMARGDGP